MEIPVQKITGMKQPAIIPLMKLDKGNLPFKVQTLQQFMDQPEAHHLLAHNHDYYEMFWVTWGSVLLRVDLAEYLIGPDMIYCVSPGQVHQVQIAEGSGGFVLSFMAPFLNQVDHEFARTCQINLFQLISRGYVITIRQEIVVEIHEIVTRMIMEFNHEYSFKIQLLSRYFKILLIYLNRQFQESLETFQQTLGTFQLTRERELVNSFLTMLEKQYKEKKMVADYASLLLLTPNYLNQIVKKITGYSAGYHIRQRVILEAKRMGRYSDAGMKEIGYTLGFSDCSHFSKFFKTFSGMNFSDFKKGALSYALVPEESLIAQAM